MKKKIIGAIILVLLIITIMPRNRNFGENEITHLVVERANTMNNYYSNKIDYASAACKLQEIESGSLLETDKNNLKCYFNTDIDLVQTCTVQSVSIKEETEDLLCADVNVYWYTSGLDGEVELTREYFVICEKDGEKFKLVGFF